LLSDDEYAALSPDEQCEYLEQLKTERADKFRSDLESVRLGNAGSAVRMAESNGLVLPDLYILSLRYQLTEYTPTYYLNIYRLDRKKVSRLAKSCERQRKVSEQ